MQDSHFKLSTYTRQISKETTQLDSLFSLKIPFMYKIYTKTVKLANLSAAIICCK